MTRSPEEIKEIELHKYFLSEKRGHDVGWQFAESDWEAKYAAAFRQARVLSDEVPAASDRPTRPLRVDPASPDRVVPPSTATRTGILQRLMDRLFGST